MDKVGELIHESSNHSIGSEGGRKLVFKFMVQRFELQRGRGQRKKAGYCDPNDHLGVSY